MNQNSLKLKKIIPSSPLKTAVLFLVFNRLDTTKEVFEAIRQAKPPRLYVAADGARESKEGEDKSVKAVREYVMQNIDWECEVKTLFREHNLGCKMAVSGAIDWFFKNEEMGIILEDDCLPSQSFFWYCEELLQRYRDTSEVFLISGDGRATINVKIENSYDFLKYPLIWGWATWRRTWEKYSVDISQWKQTDQKSILQNISSSKNTQRYWFYVFNAMANNEIDTWDYQFAYLVLTNQGKCIVPELNLISNIGFGEGATHTVESNSKNANIQNYDLSFPLVHPKKISFNSDLDSYYDLNEFSKHSLFDRVIGKILRIIKKAL